MVVMVGNGKKLRVLFSLSRIKSPSFCIVVWTEAEVESRILGEMISGAFKHSVLRVYGKFMLWKM